MAISVVCPECEHAFSVRDEYAGKRGKCPKCGGVFRAEAAEAAVSVGIPAVLAARSGVSLGGKTSTNGGIAIDAAPAPSGKKSDGGGNGKKKKTGRSHGSAPPMPIWGWISLATIAIAAFVGGGIVYSSRTGDAMAEAKKIDDGSEAEQTKQKLLDQIKSMDNEINALKTSLANAEKSIGTKPKDKTPLGEIEKRIIPGCVKVIPYIKDQPQQTTASGFFVTEKKLIATTYQICEGADKIVVKLPTGTEYEVEGIVAADEKLDVAILKPKTEMPGIELLTLAQNPVLARGDHVFAIGNPGKLEFTTSRGTITRTLSQDKYVAEKPMFDVEFTRGSSSTSFIEHDARIFPGNYGGPLLNENLEVIGMNQVLVTMVMNDGRTIVQTFGAAKEIKPIAALADKATDTIIPYPPGRKKPTKPTTPKDEEEKKDEEKKDEEKKDDEEKKEDEDGETMPDEEPGDAEEPKEDDESKDEESTEEDGDADAEGATDDIAGKIDGLFADCEKFEWTPKKSADYKKLASLAKFVTEAKDLAPGDDQNEAGNAAADKVLEKLKEVEWKDNVEKLNELATAGKPKKGAGIAVAGTVKGATNFNGSAGLMIQIDGTEKYALVLSEKASEVATGSKYLLLGQYENEQVLNFKSPDGKAGTAVMVRSKVLVSLD
jgi:S1-C subfamily serine protease